MVADRLRKQASKRSEKRVQSAFLVVLHGDTWMSFIGCNLLGIGLWDLVLLVLVVNVSYN